MGKEAAGRIIDRMNMIVRDREQFVDGSMRFVSHRKTWGGALASSRFAWGKARIFYISTRLSPSMFFVSVEDSHVYSILDTTKARSAKKIHGQHAA